VIRNGINMFKLHANQPNEFRLDNNWNDVIIGSVILVAVILDQLVHIAQAKRRTRKAAEIAAAKQRGGGAVGEGSDAAAAAAGPSGGGS
jgi:ribose transport system permease protein